jgi:methionyl-tRNA formyltransferase
VSGGNTSWPSRADPIRLKVAFAGTPDFAATVLGGLISSPHDVGLVISQPDPRKGRGRKTTRTPVAELALSHDLALRQPHRISEISDEISRYDALIVAAYGQILRPDTLYAARYGAWNVHASLLPKYRGAAPIERAIMNGETETGVTIMQMDEGLDTGPIALQRPVEIPPEMTGGELSDLLARVGSEAIVESLTLLEADDLTLVEQDSLYATYASKVSDEDKVIRWERGAGEVHDLIRALAPNIGARTFHPEVEGPIKLWRSKVVDEAVVSPEIGHIKAENGRIEVFCGSRSLEVLELQMPGGRRLSAHDFLLGNSLQGAFR